ncbi:NUDIX hydrolase [Pseudonocardia sp. WMMC193]|uniref:NUDIX hydrolase n=1 Tax=Pseudonocardia sp. WMMC193 TaxID=2911965 RepID=UPI001F1B3188|nr:NUDIX hydrolase [Pseudonocardia sp. WMMC193]MCF7551237.1 NUDIX hydrolase [Pseudonocardia sp. WMMC193]
MSLRRVVRPAAYVVCVRAGRVLLARWTGPRGPEWTLPGGGLDHGEDPRDAAVREVEEETGYTVALDRLLTVDSVHFPDASWGRDERIDLQGIRIVYAGHVTGGTLRHEIGGSTDRAEWFDRAEVSTLPRVSLVDIGLAAADAADPGAHAARAR